MKRQILALAASAALVLGACGGDDGGDDASSDTTAAAGASTSEASSSATTAQSTATSAEASATSAATATSAGATASSAAGGAAAAATPVALSEWQVDAPATYTAGAVTFDVSNAGEAPHELVVMKGTYESLPRSDIGEVLEDQLPAGTVLGETERLEPGTTATLSVDLTAGEFVLLCNLAVGPNSHAGKGQVLNVTVS